MASIDLYNERTVRVGDEQARIFAQLYGQFRQKVYMHVYRLLTNVQDAEDVTQEVFLRAHKKWHTLYDQHNLLPWLYLVATNLSIDILRLRPRVSLYISTIDQSDVDEQTQIYGLNVAFAELLYDSERGITSIAEREHIALTLAKLSRRDVQVLLLSAALDVPYKEIALQLAISPSAAASRITRAKKRFTQEYRHILAQDDKLKRRERA